MRRGKRMMFWGDIVLHQLKLIRELPKDIIALNWGYEAGHPFNRETRAFAQAGVPFYVCPGTSTWATLIGKHDNAFANLRQAARAGKANGAIGYLITEWGDGGHPQPLAVAWLPFIVGASVAWTGTAPGQAALLRVTSRDVFQEKGDHAARAAMGLGFAHRALHLSMPNATPLGATIAAPRPETHELFCRDGLKYYARLKPLNVRRALQEIERQRRMIRRHQATTPAGELLVQELDLAARMAAQSCQIILWQQALAAGKRTEAKAMARTGIRELSQLERDYGDLWPQRNKATPARSTPFFQWRIADYLYGRLHFPPEIACRT
jgi:hexosaminidase